MPHKDPEARRAYDRARYYKNREHKLRIQSKSGKRYYAANKERILAKRRMTTTPEARAAYQRAYYEKNKERKRERERARKLNLRHNDLGFRLRCNLRRRLHHVIKGRKIGSAVHDLGCSNEMLKSWLMYQFQPGMTWDNYGEWELDHVKPLASFDLTDREQFLVACNWYNLQPLWRTDNARKGDKIWYDSY